jgi:simple sugar transport system permease protein
MIPLPSEGQSKISKTMETLIRTILPVVLALLTSVLVLVVIGKDPWFFYGDVFRYGVLGNGWQQTIRLMAPLLLYSAGLIVVFRGKLWNLGYDAQYLLGSVVVAGFSPMLIEVMPLWAAFAVSLVLGTVAGAAWTLLPATLKARYGTNEIITTLMMSFIGIGISNMLVRGPFQNPDIHVPQTRVLPLADMFPQIPGTRIHIGIFISIIVVVLIHLLLTRTSFGLRLDVYGSSPKAALHVGINSPQMIIILFLLSGALIGLAASVDMLGYQGNLRANINPSYGAAVLPFVFLGRLNILATIPLVAFYCILDTGGRLASLDSGLDTHFLMIVIALILVFMSVIEYFGVKKDLGQSYLPPGLSRAVTGMFEKRKSA